MICHSYYSFFRNLANKTKFSIIMALKSGPLSVTEISKRVDEEQSKVSHNLKKLCQCHILDVKKQGKKRIYSLNKDTVIPLIDLVTKHVKINCAGRCHK